MSSDENSFKFSENSLNILKQKLEQHHKLYKKIRSKAEYLEEIVAQALEEDGQKIEWDPAGHAKDQDIKVNNTHTLQIKSGTQTKKALRVSGHRLGRFLDEENKKSDKFLISVTDYLNKAKYQVVSLSDPISKAKQKQQFEQKIYKHVYEIRYVNVEKLKNVKAKEWKKVGKQYKQTNSFGVELSIIPKLSHQVWWKIPLDLTKKDCEINI